MPTAHRVGPDLARRLCTHRDPSPGHQNCRGQIEYKPACIGILEKGPSPNYRGRGRLLLNYYSPHPPMLRKESGQPPPTILWASCLLCSIRGDPNLFMRWPTISWGSNVSVRPPSHSINNSLSNQSRAINIHSFAHTIATGRLVMISTSYISFVQLDAR